VELKGLGMPPRTLTVAKIFSRGVEISSANYNTRIGGYSVGLLFREAAPEDFLRGMMIAQQGYGYTEGIFYAEASFSDLSKFGNNTLKDGDQTTIMFHTVYVPVTIEIEPDSTGNRIPVKTNRKRIIKIYSTLDLPFPDNPVGIKIYFGEMTGPAWRKTIGEGKVIL
jgi:hypothetical protein